MIGCYFTERQVLPPRPSIPPRPITHSSSHSSDQTHSSAASSNRSSFSSSLDGNEAEVSQGDFADFSHFHDDRKGDSMAAGQGDYLPMVSLSLYASFLKGQGHQGIFSFVKGNR